MTEATPAAGVRGRVRWETRSVASLRPAAYNPREISEKALAGLGESIRRFGLVEPIIVNTRTDTVVGGHQRLKVLDASGVTETDVVLVDLSPEEEKALNLALNSPVIAGHFTGAALPILEEIRLALPELHVALRLPDLEDILAKLAPLRDLDQDAVPEPPDEPVTKVGDLIVLGRHRLLCGDSGSAEDLDRLLDGAPIHLLNTDPPYNVKVEPRSNNAIAAGLSSFPADGKRKYDDRPRPPGKAEAAMRGHAHHQGMDLARHPEKSKPTHKKMRAKDRPLDNDWMSDEDFDKTLLAWFGNASRVMIPGGGFYIWGGYANLANYPPALKASGLYFSQTVIWNKMHPVLGRKDFMGAHETCFYGWKEGAAHRWFGPNNVPDLWDIKKVNPQSMVHLTEKPVELAARALQYSSRAGENVLDLFGGSGSTLIACEQLGRDAYLMELDPAYCDVIVQRWEALTGLKAERHAATEDQP